MYEGTPLALSVELHPEIAENHTTVVFADLAALVSNNFTVAVDAGRSHAAFWNRLTSAVNVGVSLETGIFGTVPLPSLGLRLLRSFPLGLGHVSLTAVPIHIVNDGVVSG